MQDRTDPGWLTRVSRARAVVVATLACGVVAAGCGGGSTSSTTATVGRSSVPAVTVAGTGSATAAKSSTPGPPGALAFAECMRANGMPSFPDPQPGGGFAFKTASVTSSPASTRAQAKCGKLLPGGGLPGRGSVTHPSAKTLAKLLRIAVCMRQHGFSQFPDPKTSVPSDLSPDGEYSEVTDFDGAILLFPRTINMQSPAYRQALTACGAPPLGLPH